MKSPYDNTFPTSLFLPKKTSIWYYPNNFKLEGGGNYYTILYYAMLCYAMLYYTILYYTILYYTILYYPILYYTILYYTILE